MRSRLCVWVFAVAYCVSAQAHHSFAATYLVDDQISIEGQIVQLLYRNPHSFIHVMAPDSQGTLQRWAVEWSGASGLVHENVAHDTLRPGDHVIVTGNPGRNPADHRILLRSITRPADGWHWSGTFQ